MSEYGFDPAPRTSGSDLAGALAFAFLIVVWVVVYTTWAAPLDALQ